MTVIDGMFVTQYAGVERTQSRSRLSHLDLPNAPAVIFAVCLGELTGGVDGLAVAGSQRSMVLAQGRHLRTDRVAGGALHL